MSTSAVTKQSLGPIYPTEPGLRLSLTTATPVTTSNVTGATTLFYTPYKSGIITLYNGAVWTQYSTAEVSLALGTLTNATNYDVYANYSSGVVLSLVAWTNSTTRATALVRQDGVYVKSGATDHLYVGTITTTSTTTTEDSFLNRYVWNMYNRVPRILRVTETTSSWTYGSATFRNANGNAANSFNYVAGDVTRLYAHTCVVGFNTSGAGAVTGIGIDSSTVNSATTFGSIALFASGTTTTAPGPPISATYNDYPAVGSHTINWIEASQSTFTSTFYGQTGAIPFIQSGMHGELMG